MTFLRLLAALSVVVYVQGNTHPSSPPLESHTDSKNGLAIAINKRATCSNGVSVSDEACCAWFPVLDDIQQNMFAGGQCNVEAHESLRL